MLSHSPWIMGERKASRGSRDMFSGHNAAQATRRRYGVDGRLGFSGKCDDGGDGCAPDLSTSLVLGIDRDCDGNN
jgi:hypothetical protein